MSALAVTDHLALCVAYLAEQIPSATVSSRVSTRERMIRLELGSGDREDHVIDRQLLIVQAWDSDSETAFGLCATALRFLMDLPRDEVHGAHVRAVSVTGLPVEFPDPDTSTPRYQATVQLNTRPRSTQ